MYGLFTYIWVVLAVNIGTYIIRWASGIGKISKNNCLLTYILSGMKCPKLSFVSDDQKGLCGTWEKSLDHSPKIKDILPETNSQSPWNSMVGRWYFGAKTLFSEVNSLLVSRSITPLWNGDQRIVQESQRPRLGFSEEGFWAGFWKGSFTDMDVASVS